MTGRKMKERNNIHNNSDNDKTARNEDENISLSEDEKPRKGTRGSDRNYKELEQILTI